LTDSAAGEPLRPSEPSGPSGAAPAAVARGRSGMRSTIMAAFFRKPSRGLEQPIYHLIAAGKHLTIGGVAVWALWTITTHLMPSSDQTAAIVAAIREGAQAQVESSDRVAAKLEVLADKVTGQTTEVTRMQALAAGRFRCPSPRDCPTPVCVCNPPHAEPAKPLSPPAPTRRPLGSK
jgi:hypothetical protein